MKIFLKKLFCILLFLFILLTLSSCTIIIPDSTIKNVYIDIPFQSAITYNGCGIAALAMVLDYYDINIPQEEIAEEVMVEDNPFTEEEYGNPLKMIFYVKELGLKAKLKFMAINKMKGYLQEGIPVIAIQFSRFPKILENLHYRIATGYDENSNAFIFNDPLFGKDYSMEYSYFKSLNILGNINLCCCIVIYK